MTGAEDRAAVGPAPGADPGAVSERREAGCRPPSPFAYSTNAINPIRNYYLPPANPRLPGFHFTLNQDRTLTGRWVPHDTRDEVIDYIRGWSSRTEIAVCTLVLWLGIRLSKFHDWRKRYGKVNEHNAWIPRDHWLECNF